MSLSAPLQRKRKLFRILALFVPLLFFGAVELGLRIIGWGYPTNFFIPATQNPGPGYTENAAFGWRFFPRRLARAPEPLLLTKQKPKDCYRIFVLGESAALGDPEPAYGLSRMLSVLLNDRFPGKQFEVIPLAMTAINSHVIRSIARDCADFQSDLWVVYMGNNEVIGPYGAGSVFGLQTPNRTIVRASLALRTTRLGQLLDAFVEWIQRTPEQPLQWEGMKMMLQERVPAVDRRLERVLDNFRCNLDDILGAATRSKVKVLLSSVAVNLKDCPPFASAHRSELPASAKAEWDRLYAAGQAAELRRDFQQAFDAYQGARQIDDQFAELDFRLGRCFAAAGDVTKAKRSFESARDLDTLRFRADTRINQIIREAAAKRAGDDIHFLDAEALFSALSPSGIAGNEFFYEHVHFNFEGNYRLALSLARQVADLLPKTAPEAEKEPRVFLTNSECAARLAFTDWDRYLVSEDIRRRLIKPPFNGQLDQAARAAAWTQSVKDLRSSLATAGWVIPRESYQRALERANHDWILHDRFGQLLEASGNLTAAAEQWQRVIELMPHYVGAYFKLGNFYDGAGRFAEAEQCFGQVLHSRPDSVEAINGLGLVYSSQGKSAQAIQKFKLALRVKPDFAPAHVNWGLHLAAQGQTGEAALHYQEALRLQPQSVGAHINLGKLLAAQHRPADAIDHYLAAVVIQPDDAIIHYNLAGALDEMQRGPEALMHYREAIRLNPSFADAHYNLAAQLVKQGDQAGALKHFQEAVLLNPGDAASHLSLGVALAQQRRFGEAAAQFQETLRLDPGNAQAKQFLQTALSYTNRHP
jgi:tetratricopeptide (TPR) repeat protein